MALKDDIQFGILKFYYRLLVKPWKTVCQYANYHDSRHKKRMNDQIFKYFAIFTNLIVKYFMIFSKIIVNMFI